MKFVLVLYLCSFIQASDNCYQDGYGPIEYPTFGECILDGYRVSYLTLKNEYPVEEITEKKLAIKFYCKEIGENI